MKNKAKRVALMGMLTALALIFCYIETLIPFNFGIPGIKPGLANIVVVLALYSLGTGEAGVIAIMRVFIAALLFGSAMSLVYSLAGGALSFSLMLLLKKTDKLGKIGVSMSGGVAHNIGQLTAAALILGSVKIAVYLPVLLAAGLATGIINGLIAEKIAPLVKRATGI